jgi:hypothetical protein
MWKKAKKNFFENKKNENLVGPIFQARAGTITNFFVYVDL